MTSNEMRALEVWYMISRKGLNTYTNGGDRKLFFGKPDNIPGNKTQKGYSDCSSSCYKSITAAGGQYIGYNTHEQILNRAKGTIVDQTDGFYPNEANLLPGDLLYFKGNKYHVMNVGHVEMYTGSNECYGHGSGTGPKQHNLKSYCKSRATADKRYFMAIRWIPDDSETEYPTLSLGSSGAYVTRMQLMLIKQGFALEKYGADSDFGDETLTALKAFQGHSGLTVTGVCDSLTWTALSGSVTSTDDDDTIVDEVNPYVEPVKNIGRGAKGENVKWIQWELNDAGISCGTSGVDGDFGTKTEVAVLKFQEAEFPNESSEWDGIVGEKTRTKLKDVKSKINLDNDE